MADRNINFDPTVTQVTAQKSELPGIVDAGADIADNVATMSANAKALNATTQTALAFRQADAQFRQQAAGNPNDPEALKTLQDTRSQITSTIGQQVPAIASREYMSHVMEVQQNSDKLNELWGMQQSVKNAHADVNTSMETWYKMAGDSGRQFGADGGNMANLGTVIDMEHAQEAIAKLGVPVLGQPQTDALLKTFNKNYVQSFVAGLAEQHPDMASIALQQDNIKSHFNPIELDDMAKLIKKTQKTQQLLQSYTTAKNDGGLIDIVNDQNSGYAEKSNQIYRGIADGSITSKAGHAAINILHSQATVDAQTDAPIMSGIINQATALNTNEINDPGEYLQDVKDLHQQILEHTYKGDITSDDASKLSKHVDGMMASKIAKASNDAAMSLGPANDKFNVLPPELRSQATVQLFNEQYKQNWTPQQLANRATGIVQEIQTQRRQQAVKVIDGLRMSDADVLKASKYTMDDVNQTAKESGMSPQDVIATLRAHSGGAKRAMAARVSSIKGGGSADLGNDDEPSSAPASEPEDTVNTEGMQ